LVNQTGRPVIDVAVAYINTGMGRSIGWFHINNGDAGLYFLIYPSPIRCFYVLLGSRWYSLVWNASVCTMFDGFDLSIANPNECLPSKNQVLQGIYASDLYTYLYR